MTFGKKFFLVVVVGQLLDCTGDEFDVEFRWTGHRRISGNCRVLF